MINRPLLILGSSGMFGTAIKRVAQERKLNYCDLTHEELDITNKSILEKKIKEICPSIIINSAAMLGISSCEENPSRAFDINATGPLHLAQICRSQNIVLVQTSTNAIFDGKKGDFYFEEDIPNPQNVYGLSKYAGEICVQNNLLEHYIVRFAKLFGPRKNNSSGFTDKIIDLMRRGQKLKIAEDRMDPFTYTIHAARKVMDLIETRAPFGIYHVANKGSVSYYEFVSEFAKAIGYSGEIIRAKDADFLTSAPNPLRTELDSRKINDMASWKDALKEYVLSEAIKL